MRVLIAHSFYRVPGGEDRYVESQADLLSKAHVVDVLGEANDDLEPGIGTAARMIVSRAVIERVRARIRSFRPHVLHLHNPYPALGPAVHIAAARERIPLVQTVHNLRFRCPNGLMFTEGRLCGRCENGNYANAVIHRCFDDRRQAAAYAVALWSHRFIARLQNRVDAFVAPSAFIRDRLLGWDVPTARLDLIRNFAEAAAEPTPATGNGGVYVGRLSPEKGLETLVSALERAGDPAFVIVGDGPLRERLEGRIAALGLRHVTMTGRLDAAGVARTVRSAGYLVMPSECEENAPLAAIEAMALGRPILVSDRGGLPELAEGDRGVCFAAGDATGLARGLVALGTDAGARNRFGRNAHRFVRDEMSPDGHRRALETLYDRLAGRRHVDHTIDVDIDSIDGSD
jgi:glycosyltransferase involved in cell wall biosynthesis